jgi:hypothetical protein
MAVVWPSKNNFANGDVLTAANMNDIADTLNVFNPTSATNGQVWQANGTGGGAYGSIAAGGMTLLSTTSLVGQNSVTISSINQTYNELHVWAYDLRTATASTTFDITHSTSKDMSVAGFYVQESAPTTFTSYANNSVTTYLASNTPGQKLPQIGAGYYAQVWIRFRFYTQTAAGRNIEWELARTGRQNGAAAEWVTSYVQGQWRSDGPLDNLRFYITGGVATFAEGTVRIYGVK